MRLINSLTDEAKQKFSVAIDGYDSASIFIEFKPQQQGWFMTISWGDWQLSNQRISTSPNILRQFKNRIPFGIAISGVDGIDPVFKDSWISLNAFYVLDSADVETAEGAYARQ